MCFRTTSDDYSLIRPHMHPRARLVHNSDRDIDILCSHFSTENFKALVKQLHIKNIGISVFLYNLTVFLKKNKSQPWTTFWKWQLHPKLAGSMIVWEEALRAAPRCGWGWDTGGVVGQERTWKERLPAPVFWPGEFHRPYSPWGRKESDMTEQHMYV